MKKTKNSFNNALVCFLEEVQKTQPETRNFFRTATQSASKCPLPLCNAEDLLELNGVGNFLAEKCERFLHKESLYRPPGYNRTDSNQTTQIGSYRPKRRSAAYALLLALYELASVEESIKGSKKASVVAKAEKHTDVSFAPSKVPGRQTFYSGWNSMATLIKKDLVHKPDTFSFRLTKKGFALCRLLSNTRNKPVRTTSESEAVPSRLLFRNCLPDCVSLSLVLAVDFRETSVKNDEKLLCQLLQQKGLSVLKVALPLGDYLFLVARTFGDGTTEHRVLGTLVEKKRCSDLAASIKDGRYEEQKLGFDLVGVQSRVLLVEGSLRNEIYSLPLAALRQALATSESVDGFLLAKTKNANESADFLVAFGSVLFSVLQKQFGKDRDQDCALYNSFPKLAVFFATVKQKLALSDELVFAKKLCCIEAVTPRKALAIAKICSSFADLRAFMKTSDALKDVEFEPGKRLGVALSKRIFGFLFFDY